MVLTPPKPHGAVKVLKMDCSVTTGRTLDEQLTSREADKVFESYQGRWKGNRKIEGTLNLIS